MLTDVQIRNLPAPATRQHTLVNPANGLYVVRQPSGAKSFAAFPRVNGVQIKITFGPYPALSLKEANKKAWAAKGEAATGKDPSAAKKAARTKAMLEVNNTIAAVVDAYVANYLAKNCKPSWAKEAERLLRTEVVPVFGKRRLADIEDRDVHALLVRIAERAPRTSNLTFAVFRKLCNWATTLDGGKLIKVSPCVGVKALSGNNKRKRVLSDDEVRLVWRAAEKVGYPFGPIYRLALLTGLRREEVSGLMWREIDLSGAPTLTLPGERTKNGEPLVLPLSDAAVEIFETLPRKGDSKFVFTTTERTHVTGYSRAKEAIDRAVLDLLREESDDPDKVEAPPQWQMHDLRRTLATNLQKLGVRLEVTEAILNHVSGASRSDVAGVYHLHDWADEKRTALDMWSRRLAEIVEGAPAASNVTEIAKVRA